MNSWHSWSPNSKWLVFASKTFSAYTQLFLTHIDESGVSTPPVLLHNFVSAKRAANIPEFVNTSSDAIEKISEQFVDDVSFVRAAKEYVRVREYDKALELSKRALDINADNDLALQTVANVLYGRGQVKEAIEYYERVVTLTKDNSDAHYMLARAYLRTGKKKAANKHLLLAAKSKPKDPVIQVAIGNVFYGERSYEMAIERYEAALRYDKTYWIARLRKGRALKKLGQVDKAISELKILTLTDIPSWEVYNELGQLLLIKGAAPEASRVLQKAKELAPRGEVEPLVHLAYHEISLRNFKKAKQYLHNALATSPRNGRAHSAMGHLMLKTGRYHAAEKHYRAALYNVADKGYVHFELGNLYAKKKRKSLARKHFKKALEYSPDNKKAKRALWRLGH